MTEYLRQQARLQLKKVSIYLYIQVLFGHDLVYIMLPFASVSLGDAFVSLGACL